MKSTMIRRLVITVTRIVASGRSKDLARLMCHREETADLIYNSELHTRKVWKKMKQLHNQFSFYCTACCTSSILK